MWRRDAGQEGGQARRQAGGQRCVVQPEGTAPGQELAPPSPQSHLICCPSCLPADIFDFLVDIVPREEANEPAVTNGGAVGGGLALEGMPSGQLQGAAPTGMQMGQQQAAAAAAAGMGMFQPQQAQQFMAPPGQGQQQQYLVPSGQQQQAQQQAQQQFMAMPQGQQQQGGGSNQGSGSGGTMMFNPYMPAFAGFAQQPGMQMQQMQFPQQLGSAGMMQQGIQQPGGPSLQ